MTRRPTVDPFDKKPDWLPMFMKFIGRLTINSKETGTGPLKPYHAQQLFLEQICQGLDAGQRFFVNLKARQLGISTISLAIDIFWLSMFPGMQGALITDTEGNRDIFRGIIARYLKGLPKQYSIPVLKHNRTVLEFKNGSVLQYLVAGQRGKKELGTSRALNFVHATEVAKWGEGVNFDSFMATLAETHPHRLYVFESTANGFNHFKEMWTRAQEDSHTQKAFFIGWWAKEIYRIEKTDPRYAEFMADPPTEEERTKASIVSEAYGHIVQPEQLAWYRWRAQTRTFGEGSMEQEFPWHEEEAFLVTGKFFFPAKRLSEDLRRVLGPRPVLFQAYRYALAETFTATTVDLMTLEQVHKSSLAHLRVWAPPVTRGVYAIGVDPAYGRNDWKDSHCIEVYRGYADRLVQVAEYATPDPETFQVIWVLAHLAAMYHNCLIIPDVNGPGMAVMQGLKQLKAQIRLSVEQTQGVSEPMAPKGFTDALNAARWYLYHRPDSMGAGYAYGWKTQGDNKLVMLNQMRDSYHLRLMEVMSGPLLREMEMTVQDGVEVGAYGKGKDDRVFASALAHKAWLEWLRPGLIANRQTWASVTEQERQNADQHIEDSFVGGIVRSHLHDQAQQRKDDARRRAFEGRFHP